jgi:hypothetical protein
MARLDKNTPVGVGEMRKFCRPSVVQVQAERRCGGAGVAPIRGYFIIDSFLKVTRLYSTRFLFLPSFRQYFAFVPAVPTFSFHRPIPPPFCSLTCCFHALMFCSSAPHLHDAYLDAPLSLGAMDGTRDANER